MSTENIERLLQRADDVAGRPTFDRITASSVRRRIHRRRVVRTALPLTAAAVLAVGLLVVCMRAEGPQSESQRIASLEEQVKQLQARTEAALNLVRDVVAQERQQQRLDELEAELASIRDPAERIREQTDKAALTLLYQGDRFYRELNQPQSAIDAYEQVIRVFPKSRWADEARQRLAKIKTSGSRNI